jgi:hypothetical protein
VRKNIQKFPSVAISCPHYLVSPSSAATTTSAYCFSDQVVGVVKNCLIPLPTRCIHYQHNVCTLMYAPASLHASATGVCELLHTYLGVCWFLPLMCLSVACFGHLFCRCGLAKNNERGSWHKGWQMLKHSAFRQDGRIALHGNAEEVGWKNLQSIHNHAANAAA